MAIQLHSLKRISGVSKPARRVGRGNASGRGTYSGRGLKGQLARSGGKGGIKQMALKAQLFSKLPKFKSFKSLSCKTEVVNVGILNSSFKDGDVVTPKKLLDLGLISKRGRIKILGAGSITKKITIKAHSFSKTSIDAINKAGGKVEILGVSANESPKKNPKKAK